MSVRREALRPPLPDSDVLELTDSEDDVEDDTTLSQASPASPASLLRCSYNIKALSILNSANRWVKQGARFPDGTPLPHDLHQLCVAVTTVPEHILKAVLPSDDIPVSTLIDFRLPGIAKWPFSKKITFKESAPGGRIFIRSEIPPEPYVEELRKNLVQALLDGKFSMLDPRTTDIRLPLWAIELWRALHSVHNYRTAWSEGRGWITTKRAEGHDIQIFRKAERLLTTLPWNKLLDGPAAGVGRTTKHLIRFLSDEEWLSDALIDMMTAYLASQLSTTQQDTIIVDTRFRDAIVGAKDIKYHDQPHHQLQEIEQSIGSRVRRLYAPMYTNNHYVAFEIDFRLKCFRWGDSLNLSQRLNSNQRALESLIEKLQWWFSRRFGGEFDNRGPSLPHGSQKDHASCGLFAINTIEHNVFGQTLGVANPARERARWFCLTSETQLLEPVAVSNAQAPPQEAEQGPLRIQKITKERLAKETQEKEQQDRIKLAEKLEREKLEREKQERERQERERQERERQERERQERERQERERQERERQERERQERERQHDVEMHDVNMGVTGAVISENRSMALESAVPLNTGIPPAPAPSSQSMPLESRLVARFNRMDGPAADTLKTRWFIKRLGQFDIPDAVNLEFIKHPDYPSLHVVSRGRLVVSKRTEVRLRLWRAQYPDVPLWYLGIRCLSRGLDWQVLVSAPRLAASIPRPAHLSDRRPPLNPYGDVFLEYHTRVRAMLNLPFARRFLSMGGILWRIALHYGPKSLFAAALSGPSTDAYVHGHVNRIGGEIDDMVTDADIALLLGTEGFSSLWPPPDIFEMYEKWQGEWSHEWEAWFQRRLQGIQARDKSLFVTRQKWIRYRRRLTVKEYNDPELVGSEGHAARLCIQADSLYPPTESYASLI